MANPTLGDWLPALERVTGKTGRRSGDEWRFPCPAHDGTDPNLSIIERDGKILTTCHSRGCDHEAIRAALGIEATDVRAVEHQYEYRQADGKLHLTVRMKRDAVTGKKIGRPWREPRGVKGPHPLYRLPELLKANQSLGIVIVEGEHTCDTVRAAWPDRPVVTWAGGCKSWKQTDWNPLAKRKVTICADADSQGRKAAREIAKHLCGQGCTVETVLPDGETGDDLADWLAESTEAAGERVRALREPFRQEVAAPSPGPLGDPADHFEDTGHGVPPGDLVSECMAIASAANDPDNPDPGAPFEPEALAKLMLLRSRAPADWMRVRARLAKTPGVIVGTLDKMTARAAGESDGKQGRAITFDDPEPWPDPVDGAELLDEIAAVFRHYVEAPESGIEAVALWAQYTYSFECFAVSPYLMVTAPERDCGKSRVTDLLRHVVRRGKTTSDASAAALFRIIERDCPTLLFDEAQSFLKRDRDDPLRGILLAGFTRNMAYVDRVVGEDHEVRTFSTFAPKAMNGRKLAGIDDMLTSRSVVLAMSPARNRKPHLRVDHDPFGNNVRSRCQRWANDHAAALVDAEPDMGEIINRASDVWRPLFAVADAAGGAWPGRARAAAASLAASAAKVGAGESRGVMLLSDIRDIFADQRDIVYIVDGEERIKSQDLDNALNALPERPWSTLAPGGRPMTHTTRGNLLKPYGIKAATLKFDGKDAKGYKRTVFESSWESYIPETPGIQPVAPLPSLKTKDFSKSQHVARVDGRDGLSVHETPLKSSPATGQRVVNPPAPGEGVSLPSQPPGTERAGEAYRRVRDGEY